jgi:O-antigen ligase/cytochrome c-type biogenesis protein CcmH/NrfG
MGKRSREKKERKNIQDNNLEGGNYYKTGLEKTCLFIIRWATYALMFAPLVLSINFFFPFVAPKTFFFRILVEIIAATYLFLVAINWRRYIPRINPLNIAVFVFLAIFILTSFTGVDLARSFWSTYERMTGILTMLHLVALFVILPAVFQKKNDWNRVFTVSILVGIILSFYVLIGSEISTRGGGTIGNTSFMAAYLLFDIFFAIILFLSQKNWLRIYSGVTLAIMIPVLLTSTARGAIISFLGGIFLMVLGYLFFSRKELLKRSAIGIVISLAVLGILSAVIQPAFIEGPIENTLSEMKPRFVIWEKAWKGFLDKPILGWGPENFNVVFNKYFNPCTFLSECGGEVWFDRAHNIVLDTLVTMGAIGLISYLAIFAVAIYLLWKLILKRTENGEVFVVLGLAVLLAVYFAQNLLVFDMINTYLVLFLVFAYISFLIQKKEEFTSRSNSLKLTVAIFIVAPMIFILWTTNVQPMIANHHIIKAVSSNYLDEAVSSFEKSTNSWMYPYEAREQFSQRLMKSIYGDFSQSELDELAKAFSLAEEEMKKAVESNPIDFRQYLFLGQLYNSFYRITSDPDKLVKAEEALNKAIELGPTNQQGYWNLAETKTALRDMDSAIKLLEKSVELEPRVGSSHWYLAMAYNITGNIEKSLEHITKAKENGYNWEKDTPGLEKVISIYETLGDDNKLIYLYQKAIELDPNNANYWAFLASSYANIGEYQRAREAAEKVKELDSSKTESINNFINQLP